ncbi:NUMOD4 motif-containing HNH endonuclease [Lysinibacillus halotolerans]
MTTTIEKEVWKDIKGYEGMYQVSNLGRVKSLPRIVQRSNGRNYTVKERLLKIRDLKFKGGKKTRKTVRLKSGENKIYLVHRLVAEAFIPNPDALPQVNHIDGNPSNNNVDNLEWVTCKENAIHAYQNGLMKTVRKVAKISPLTGDEIETYVSGSEAARIHKVSPSAIFHAINNKWKVCGYNWEYRS